MNNLLADTTNFTIASTNQTVNLGNATYPLATLQARLDALILVLKTCKGEVCRNPWNQLLPGRNVKLLTQAMNSQYDSYFEQLPKVSYSICEGGYILASEGALWEDSLSMTTDIHSLARRGRPMGNRP
jgi:N-acetylglucosamine-6-sulfatase